jgi:hypothetical protein
MSKEMPVIPVNRVVDPKRITIKNGGPRRRRGTPPTKNKSFRPKRSFVKSIPVATAATSRT